MVEILIELGDVAAVAAFVAAVDEDEGTVEHDRDEKSDCYWITHPVVLARHMDPFYCSWYDY